MLGYVYSLIKKKKKKKKGDVTILCDTPYVRDVSALFGHGNKANRFHSTHGLPHVETGGLPSGRKTLLDSSKKFRKVIELLVPSIVFA